MRPLNELVAQPGIDRKIPRQLDVVLHVKGILAVSGLEREPLSAGTVSEGRLRNAQKKIGHLVAGVLVGESISAILDRVSEIVIAQETNVGSGFDRMAPSVIGQLLDELAVCIDGPVRNPLGRPDVAEALDAHSRRSVRLRFRRQILEAELLRYIVVQQLVRARVRVGVAVTKAERVEQRGTEAVNVFDRKVLGLREAL